MICHIQQDKKSTNWDLGEHHLWTYVHGTCRKQVILRHFNDHADEISSYIDTKQKKNHDVRCFSHIGDKTDSQVHIMI